MDHVVVQRWLRSVIITYINQDRVYADVDRALIAVSSLTPKTEVFTFNDGRTQLLLLLTGNIPIQFRKVTYNIPVAFWLPKEYPREPPMAFVVPTPDMLVQKGPNVDPSGQVGGEYLNSWRSKPEACNLLDLIQSCQQIFGQEPPVYAKPKTTASPAPGSAGPSSPVVASPRQSLQDPRQRPPPPSPAALSDSAPPSRPPKPQSRPGSIDFASPSLSLSGAAGSSFARPSPYKPGSGPAPLRSASGDYGGMVRGHHAPSRSTSIHVSPMTGGEPQSPPPQPQHQPQQYHQYAQPPQVQPPPPIVHPHPRQASASYQPISPPPQPKPQQSNIMDALDDSGPSLPAGPAPPRPPNPELLSKHDMLLNKIQGRLSALSASLDQSNRHLMVLSSDLDCGRPAIEDEMSRLQAVRDVCKATGDRTKETVLAAKARIEWLKQRQDPDVDEIVVATSIVGNQLVDLVAEDNAIEDTLYQLGRVLNAERIDLDRFLKQTRMLAREQFMKRALAQHIVQGMGWE